MINQKTPYMKFPLPHPDNLLEDDVLRMRTALTNIDGLLWLLHSPVSMPRFPFVLADGTETTIGLSAP